MSTYFAVSAAVVLAAFVVLYLYLDRLRKERALRNALIEALRRHFAEHPCLEYLDWALDGQYLGSKLYYLQQVVRTYADRRMLDDFESEEILVAMRDVVETVCRAVRCPNEYLSTPDLIHLRAFLDRSDALAALPPFSAFTEEMWNRWEYETRRESNRMAFVPLNDAKTSNDGPVE